MSMHISVTINFSQEMVLPTWFWGEGEGLWLMALREWRHLWGGYNLHLLAVHSLVSLPVLSRLLRKCVRVCAHCMEWSRIMHATPPPPPLNKWAFFCIIMNTAAYRPTYPQHHLLSCCDVLDLMLHCILHHHQVDNVRWSSWIVAGAVPLWSKSEGRWRKDYPA